MPFNEPGQKPAKAEQDEGDQAIHPRSQPCSHKNVVGLPVINVWRNFPDQDSLSDLCHAECEEAQERKARDKDDFGSYLHCARPAVRLRVVLTVAAIICCRAGVPGVKSAIRQFRPLAGRGVDGYFPFAGDTARIVWEHSRVR